MKGLARDPGYLGTSTPQWMLPLLGSRLASTAHRSGIRLTTRLRQMRASSPFHIRVSARSNASARQVRQHDQTCDGVLLWNIEDRSINRTTSIIMFCQDRLGASRTMTEENGLRSLLVLAFLLPCYDTQRRSSLGASSCAITTTTCLTARASWLLRSGTRICTQREGRMCQAAGCTACTRGSCGCDLNEDLTLGYSRPLVVQRQARVDETFGFDLRRCNCMRC